MDNFVNSSNALYFELSENKPCASFCGMCPSCVFAETPPVSAERLWTVGDSFHRRFLMDLLSRCRSLQVLEKIQRVLKITSWTMFNYRETNRLPNSKEKPLGFSGHEIREWFDSSPDWKKSHYLCRLLLHCDTSLLRALANLTSVLLIRQQRGLQPFEDFNTRESDEPALMVVPGSSASYSGISRYKDFITDLPVNLSKRILGFLDEPSLKICFQVSKRWQLLAKDTLSEMKFRKRFNEEIMEVVKSKNSNVVSPYYANIVKVRVPASGDKSCDEEGHLEMKLVEMEERNIYCGGYFTTDVMDKPDPHRVIDYEGKSLMALASKDSVVRLLHVSMEAKVILELKGNRVQIRAVRLCEDKDLVITGSFDTIIRCWNLKSKTCVMTLLGHTGAVNCLDVCEDRLVSGAKDCTVKIWNLQNGKLCDQYNFKHPGSVQCVKISQTRVYSSCYKGQVKIWDLEKASVLKVIDAHQSSVRCLFFDEWHLLTGDANGVVMAWSTNCENKDCLKTFNHPKEVKSLTLTYLRVVTGCTDGKIRIFNFLTGTCLRVIVAGSKSNCILSVHFHETRIVVNSVANVKLHHFGEVFWDYADSANKDEKHVRTAVGVKSDSSNQAPASAPVYKVSSPHGKMHNRRKSLLGLTSSTSTTQDQNDSVKVTLSEKATSERIKKRGLHQLPTRDSILLKINTIKKATCMDEVGINMERNARLRDDWGSPTPSNDIATKATNTQASKGSISSPKWAPNRGLSTAPGHMIRPFPPQVEKTKSQGVKTQRLMSKSAKDVTKDESKNVPGKSLSVLESFLKCTKNIKSVDAFNNEMELKLLTITQLEERAKSQREAKDKTEGTVKKKKGL